MLAMALETVKLISAGHMFVITLSHGTATRLQGTVTQWKELCHVTRRLWVQHSPMPLRSNPEQVACLSLSHVCDSLTDE